MRTNLFAIVLNWNDKDNTKLSLDSLLAQTLKPQIILVDNGSTDGSVDYFKEHYPQVELLELNKNYGFAKAVNAGLWTAIDQGAQFVALLNNDAEAKADWLEQLHKALVEHPECGIATGRLMDRNHKNKFDGAGEAMTVWGLHYPRGRGESVEGKYEQAEYVFGGTGGASLFRTKMLKQIGYFDESFFFYYEDVDLNFRAQLYGWRVWYTPKAVAYHAIGASSGKVKNLATYQTLRNLPMVIVKNLPLRLWFKVAPRFYLAYYLFFFNAIRRGQYKEAINGLLAGRFLELTKLPRRWMIQRSRVVSVDYIDSLLERDLPPGARGLRRLFKN